ncbi:Mycothiol acetyltransferase [Nocardioides dokdonensis FR1436]|uniref:Mycothiol acetyltransferase n=1 Tax=Nocardioides dokdonensis FR1436 TaxID=1300347 RepID=A0A1A9GPX9_9ACTN|nr:GNAT family N-acetyltransferase [Nocardioides dokdonensis]ANH40364.1 Mycothiol acetyltransferase [Nocardioides dokdonensis FR1436]
MRIRLAGPADHVAVGDVTAAAYAPFLLGPDDPYVARLRDAATRAREAELWVASPDDSDEVLGSVTDCPPGSPWREVAEDDEGEFRMLSVAPGTQGQGVGRALVDHVLQRWRVRGASVVVLSSLREMSTAHRLYGRLGFERLPERDWQPVPDVHLICFRRNL